METQVVSYQYDSWGKPVGMTDATADGVGSKNPFRYREYCWDEETGLYYVNSRYYDPETCRFISADDISLVSASPMALTDKNLYAYCDNNPIARLDLDGMFWMHVAAALTGAVVNVAITYVSKKVTGQDFTPDDFLLAAATGAINTIPRLGPWANGIINGVCTYWDLKDEVGNGTALFCGVLSGIASKWSISNMANITKDTITVEKIKVNAAMDLTFGTGFSLGTTAISRGAVLTSENRTVKSGNTGKKISSKNSVKKTVKKPNAALSAGYAATVAVGVSSMIGLGMIIGLRSMRRK